MQNSVSPKQRNPILHRKTSMGVPVRIEIDDWTISAYREEPAQVLKRVYRADGSVHVEVESELSHHLTRAPVMTSVGGDESSEFLRQNSLLGERWKSAFAGDIPMPGRHHFSIVDALAEEQSPLFQGVRKLMKLDQ